MVEHDISYIIDKLDKEVIPSINLIKTQVAVIDTKLNRIDALETKSDELFDLILGDGTEKNKGIIRDVDLLKTWKDARVWLERIVAVAVVGELIGLGFLMIRLVVMHQ